MVYFFEAISELTFVGGGIFGRLVIGELEVLAGLVILAESARIVMS